ncbi:tyrosine-type recombinase/integrase [Streptomyces sp. NBC_01618]|nr:tyrosine-type recombinase/integrase [Streptomyces sp. NBC_01618]
MQDTHRSALRTQSSRSACSMATHTHPHTASADTRHTYASIMLEAGDPVVTLAQRLGHSSPTNTLGYYAHFMPEAGNRGRAVIDGFLGKRVAGQNSPDSPQG